ncbi:MAG: hypothetical protein H8D67_13140 [Deltaproteobacteria bacterium]|nr:hypothetical protein [Deltaproteobacteria bacterium]
MSLKIYKNLWIMLVILVLIPVGTALARPKIPFVYSEWVIWALQKLEVDGITGGIHSSSSPWTRGEVAEIIARSRARIAAGVVTPKPIDAQLLERLEAIFAEELDMLRGQPVGAKLRFAATPQLRSVRNEDINIRPAFEGALGYSAGMNFHLYEEFEVGRLANKYPQDGKTIGRRIHSWHEDYVAEFTRAYLRCALSKVDVIIGRDIIFWGPGYRGALGISDNSPPFDLILLTGKFGSVKGYSFAAVLDKMWDAKRIYHARRYLSGHRIDWQVNDRLELGLSEIITYGGDVRNVEWQYLNPILPYYASQYNSDLDDNVMFVGDFACQPTVGTRIYGEILIDDFQYAGHAPNAWGMLMGCYLSNLPLSPNLDARAEYTRINRWAYTHRIAEDQYLHFGSIIGHWLGPDADDLYIELSYPLHLNTHIQVNYEFQRQGAATVADRYKGEEYKQIPFPSGIVESTHSMGIRALYESLRDWHIDARYTYSIYRSKDNVVGNNGHQSELRLTVKYLYHSPP